MTETSDERYEVVIVKYGTRRTVRSEVYLNYGLYHEDDGPIGMDYFVWIIRNARRTILVDTGFSPQGGSSRGRDTLIAPPAAWTRLGITAESAPTIIITHAHYDHIGNLDHFPTSPIVIAEAELDFWSGPHAHRALFHHSVEDSELAALTRARSEGRVTAFTDRLTVAPGVEVLRVGGHTPGQSVVIVSTERGPVMIASDAVHYYEELERSMPFTSVADLVGMYDGFDHINSLLADGSIVAVVSGHDPSTLSRFAPFDSPLAELAAVVGAGEVAQ